MLNENEILTCYFYKCINPKKSNFFLKFEKKITKFEKRKKSRNE